MRTACRVVPTPATVPSVCHMSAFADDVLLVSEGTWRSHGDRIGGVAPDLEVVVCGDDPLPQDVLDRVTLAFFSADTWPDHSRGIIVSILKSPRLRWLQTFSAGVDSPFFVDLMSRGVRLTTASGATASPIAQTAIMYMLALSRDLRSWMRAQDAREWRRHDFDELEGSSLAVVGMGPIGREIARLASALGMHVEAVRRTPTDTDPWPVRGMDSLDEVLSRSRWVACALPLNDDTRGIFDARRFALMPNGSYFVNVGRGELVDEEALLAALQSGHLAGAGLDVFAVEPLPADSPLWSMDNVIVTPHNSGSSTSTGGRSTDIFFDNLARLASGQPLVNEASL